MTPLLALLPIGIAVGWWARARYDQALRVDRDLHEQSHHMNADAVWRLERRIERWINNPRIPARAHRIATRKQATP